MRPEPQTIAAGARPPVRGAVAAHPGSRQVSRLIYGAIIGLALYSEVIGARIRSRRHPDGELFRHIVDDVGAVAFGVGFPAAFFVLAATGAIGVGTAFAVAKWSGLGLIAFYGFCAARLAGAKLAASLLQGLAVGIIGGLLIAFKALVH
jgi:hypothetical protein